jgi:hypothetical protein
LPSLPPALADDAVVPVLHDVTWSGSDPVLSWDRVPGATQYTLELATTYEFSAGTTLPKVTTTTNAWVPTGSLAGAEDRTVFWRVSAKVGSVTSGPSDPGTLSVDHIPAPGGLSPASGAVVAYPDPVVFTWDAVPGAAQYDIQYTAEPAGWTNATSIIAKTTSATPAKLLARDTGSPWRWRVRAEVYSGIGTQTAGPWAEVADGFTVTWPSASSQPTALAPADRGETNVTVADPVFTWTPVKGAAKYEITLGAAKVGDGDTATVKEDANNIVAQVTSTTYVPAALLADRTYYWQVTALDPAGNRGKPSTLRQFKKVWAQQSGPLGVDTAEDDKTAYPHPLVGATTLETATSMPIDKVALSWEPVARANHYVVQMSPIITPTNPNSVALTCVTPSTSVTPMAAVSTTSATTPTALQQVAPSCLWNADATKRIAVGVTYKWTVYAIDLPATSTSPMSATVPPGALTSAVSPARYVTITDPSDSAKAADGRIAVTASSTTLESAGQPAPLLSWDRFAGASAYEVRVSLNRTMTTNLVGKFLTTGTVLAIPGAFVDNSTNESYYWDVQPVVPATGDAITFTNMLEMVVDSKIVDPSDEGQWKKVSTAPGPIRFTADPANPTTVVASWTPQFDTAAGDGGSRGYAITLYDEQGATIGQANVDEPLWVVRNPKTGAALAPGTTYALGVAALDSAGRAGTITSTYPSDLRTIPSDPVTNLQAEVSGSGVRFGWEPGGAVSSYSLSYGLVGGTVTTLTDLTQPAGQAESLAPGTYSWKVVAYDKDKVATTTSGPDVVVRSASVTLSTPDQTVFSANPMVTGRQAPVLHWSPVPGASRYLVQVAPATSDITTATKYETTSTSFVPFGGSSATSPLAFGTKYQWQVQAVPEIATTSATRPVLARSATPRTFTITTAPGAVALGSARATGTSVAATWSAPTGAAAGSTVAPSYDVRYRVYDASGIVTTWPTTVHAASDARQLVISGLAQSTTYEFQLRATNAEGDGPWSTSVRATTATVPDAVRSATVTPTLNGLTVRWSSPSSNGGSTVTAYTVKYRTGTSAWATTSVTTTSITLTGLSGAKKYDVSIAAVNGVGTGAATLITGTTYSAASAPHSVKVVRGDRSATVTWTKPTTNGGSAITGYVVQLSTYSASTKKWSAWVSKSTTTATTYKAVLTGLVNGTSYHVRVYAKTTPAPVGTASATLSVVPAGKPLAPSSVKVAVAKGSAKVTWKKPSANGSAITSYVLQYSTNGRTWSTKAYPKASATSYTWSKPSKGKTYYVRIYAKSAVGSGTVSASVRFVAK